MRKKWLGFLVLGFVLMASCASFGTNGTDGNIQEMLMGAWFLDEGHGTTILLDFRTETDFHILQHQAGALQINQSYRYTLSGNRITFHMPVGNRNSILVFNNPRAC